MRIIKETMAHGQMIFTAIFSVVLFFQFHMLSCLVLRVKKDISENFVSAPRSKLAILLENCSIILLLPAIKTFHQMSLKVFFQVLCCKNCSYYKTKSTYWNQTEFVPERLFGVLMFFLFLMIYSTACFLFKTNLKHKKYHVTGYQYLFNVIQGDKNCFVILSIYIDDCIYDKVHQTHYLTSALVKVSVKRFRMLF